MVSKMNPLPLNNMRKLFTRKTPVEALKGGFAVCLDMPFLGTSPDGRDIDFHCRNHFGLGEVKCPETKCQVTPLEACQDPNFFVRLLMDNTDLKGIIPITLKCKAR